MIVKKITTEDQDIRILGMTLLSVEEAKALPDDIRTIGKPWWLRSPGISAYDAAIVLDLGTVNDYGFYVNGDEYGIRPALIIDQTSSNLQIGDRFALAGYEWTVIKEYALCNDCIGECTFREDWQAEDANIYEASDVKRFIEAWATENGILNSENEA